MNQFEAYELYLSMKTHFTEPHYDFMEKLGRTNCSVSAFNRRKDRYKFEKLANHKDPFGLLLANFLDGGQTWIGDLVSEESQEVYMAWLKRKESLSYIFSQDLKKLDPVFDNNIKFGEGEYPRLITAYRRKNICVETLLILDELCQCFDYWDRHIEDAMIYPHIAMKVRKYKSFINVDKDKYKKIVVDTFG